MFLMPVTTRRVANGHAHDLSRAFDRLFDDTVDRVFGSAAAPASVSRLPALDLRETDTAYGVSVDLPGVAKEDVKITIDGRHVSIDAECRREQEKKEGERVLYRERSSQSFSRSFTLPVEVDQDGS